MLRGGLARAYHLWPILGILAILGALVSGCTLRASGQELVQRECTRCHTLAPIEVEGRTQSQWEDVVRRMVEHGADLRAGHVERVVEYLAENYGPGNQ